MNRAASSKQQVGERFKVLGLKRKKTILEFRKLIVIIISTNFLCWRSNLEKKILLRVLSGFQTLETIKPLALEPRGFKGFLAFGNL